MTHQADSSEVAAQLDSKTPELDPSGTCHTAEYSTAQNRHSSSIRQQHVQSFMHGAIFQLVLTEELLLWRIVTFKCPLCCFPLQGFSPHVASPALLYTSQWNCCMRVARLHHSDPNTRVQQEVTDRRQTTPRPPILPHAFQQL